MKGEVGMDGRFKKYTNIRFVGMVYHIPMLAFWVTVYTMSYIVYMHGAHTGMDNLYYKMYIDTLHTESEVYDREKQA